MSNGIKNHGVASLVNGAALQGQREGFEAGRRRG